MKIVPLINADERGSDRAKGFDISLQLLAWF